MSTLLCYSKNMNKVKHVKDPRCWEENEDYYLNRRIVKAHTKDKVYYYQRVDGIIVKTEVTLYQWKELYETMIAAIGGTSNAAT